MVKQLEPNSAYLMGLVAELGRGFYWPLLDDRQRRGGQGTIDEDVLLAGLRAPRVDSFMESLRTWRDNLPCRDPRLILDFFYLEQRLGCWAGGLRPAYAGYSLFELWPLNHRRIVELILTLPESYKKEAQLNVDVIERNWPELLSFGFNEGNALFELLEIPFRAGAFGRRAARRIRRALEH